MRLNSGQNVFAEREKVCSAFALPAVRMHLNPKQTSGVISAQRRRPQATFPELSMS